MGKYDNHILFDIRPLHHSFYRIKEKNDSFSLEAGEVHGVTNNAHFEVYSAPNTTSTPLCSLIANKVQAFSSTLSIHNDGTHEIDNTEASTVPAGAWALQVHPGEEASVYINISSEELEKRIESETDLLHGIIRLAKNEEEAELVLSAGENNEVGFMTKDKICSRYGLETLPYSSPNIDSIRSVLRHATHFFWHLRRMPQTNSQHSTVAVKASRLIKSDSDGRSTLVPTGHNLIRDDVILIKDVEKRIGFSIKNNSFSALHVWAFGFNMSDLSIGASPTSFYSLSGILIVLDSQHLQANLSRWSSQSISPTLG